MTVFSWKGERDTIMTPNDSIRYYKQIMQTGMLAMEPQSGHVKVWVGGINYKHFQYDHVSQGARQVGSTFKPIVYATAIKEMGMSPCDSIVDSPFTIPVGRHNVTETWTVTGSGLTRTVQVWVRYPTSRGTTADILFTTLACD